MTDEFLKELYLKAYNASFRTGSKHLAGLRAVRDYYNQPPLARPEGAKWKPLDDHTSTPSCTSVLASERKKSFTHWFTTMVKGEWWYYKVEVPAFEERSPQQREGG